MDENNYGFYFELDNYLPCPEEFEIDYELLEHYRWLEKKQLKKEIKEIREKKGYTKKDDDKLALELIAEDIYYLTYPFVIEKIYEWQQKKIETESADVRNEMANNLLKVGRALNIDTRGRKQTIDPIEINKAYEKEYPLWKKIHERYNYYMEKFYTSDKAINELSKEFPKVPKDIIMQLASGKPSNSAIYSLAQKYNCSEDTIAKKITFARKLRRY